MKKLQLILAALGIAVMTGFYQPAQAYDTQEYKKINSSLACQCGCGLLVSVCTMESCMCVGVRQEVGEMLDEGYEPEVIKQAMVTTYGEQILAAPPKSGFNLSAYILPFAFLILGGSVLYSIITKWIPEQNKSVNNADEEESQDNSHIPESRKSQIENEINKLDL
jgi:cytochrome c-type biogenesis protein CcmH